MSDADVDSWMSFAYALGVLVSFSQEDNRAIYKAAKAELYDDERFMAIKAGLFPHKSKVSINFWVTDRQGSPGRYIWAILLSRADNHVKLLMTEQDENLVRLMETKVSRAPISWADFRNCKVANVLRQSRAARTKLAAINPLFATMPAGDPDQMDTPDPFLPI